MSDALAEGAARAIAEHGMLAPGARVLAACSGGADSTALLHALHELGYRGAVAHLDHGARPESGDDAAFVVAQAAALGWPCITERRDIAALSQTSGLSFEMQARESRYAFLVASARAQQCDAIATGHTRSDQAETVLMRMLRGTGPGGLAGIPPVGKRGDLPLVRPLIGLSREEVRALLTQRNIPWREDASNEEAIYLRNRVRAELLPLLRTYNPEVEEALARLADHARMEDAHLREQAAEAFRAVVEDDAMHRSEFASHHPALQHRMLMAWLEAHGLPLEADGIERAAQFIASAHTGAQLSLAGGRLLYAGRTHAMMLPETDALPQEARLPVPGEATLCGRRFIATQHPNAPQPLRDYCNPTQQWLRADALSGELQVRTLLPGDRIAPLGMQGTRLVADILAESGMPRPERTRFPLLALGEEIIWIPGGPVSRRAAITDATQPAVKVECQPCA